MEKIIVNIRTGQVKEIWYRLQKNSLRKDMNESMKKAMKSMKTAKKTMKAMTSMKAEKSMNTMKSMKKKASR